MSDPLYTYSNDFCALLDCPVHGNDAKCNIPLPLQSPLGIYAGLHYQPIGEWPAVFLCLRHERVFACHPDTVHLEIEVRGLGEPAPSLWKIECECAHENCGKLHTIYTARMPDWTAISKRILKLNPRMDCDGHEFVWCEDLLRGAEFAHDSPKR